MTLRSSLFVVVIALVVAACDGGVATDTTTSTASRTSGTSSTATPEVPTPPSTAPDGATPCGDDLPLISAALAERPPDPGPLTGRDPALPGQLVVHVAEETVGVEMRWPVDPGDVEGTAPELTVADLAAHVEETPAGPVVVIDLGEERGPCRWLGVAAAGFPRDAVVETLDVFLDSLVDPNDPGIVAAQRTTLPADPEPGRDPGACATPVTVDLPGDASPPVADADELVQRLLADRFAGLDVSGCLTASGRAAFGPRGPFEPAACLYECADGTIPLPESDAPEVEGSSSGLGTVFRSVVLRYASPDGTSTPIREEYEVRAIEDDGVRRLSISNVQALPVSFVSEADARTVITELLDALAAGAYDVAVATLVNEGVSEAIERRVPGLMEGDAGELLAAFCRRAACDARFRIAATVGTEPFRRTMLVAFATDDGEVSLPFPVGAFEGVLTVGELPPDGSAADAAGSLADRWLPDRGERSVAIVRSRSIELDAPEERSWTLWHGARFADEIEVVGGWVAFGARSGEVLLAQLGDPETFRDPVTIDRSAPLVGAGPTARGPAVFIGGERLVRHDLGSSTSSTLYEPDSGLSVIGASSAGDVTVVTLIGGDSVRVVVVGAGGMATDLPLGLEPATALAGIARLDRESRLVAVPAGGGIADRILLATLDGEVVGEWELGVDGLTVRRVDFDGRYLVAELIGSAEMLLHGRPDPARWIIDVVTGEGRVVPAAGTSVRFP